MCFKVPCPRCGKFTWTGCGKHVQSVYDNIEEGKHCMCQAWPGIVIPSVTQITDLLNQQPPVASASSNGEVKS
ncbi:hypothetical protein Syun_015760 [Stephania yunnanensis]|uniref:Uncharacterized protein n=1 Tax=Stephania yunnanensis TaxID=152371 RepID=A0AAP0JMM0_9MAGN